MPFKKITHGKDKGKYLSKESGKKYTKSQVNLYYATHGFNPKELKKLKKVKKK